MRALFCVFCISIHWRSPHFYTLQTIVVLLCTFYLRVKYVLPPVLFTLTQINYLIITRVQIQSNLGTTAAYHALRPQPPEY
jgi:hypothetical protein